MLNPIGLSQNILRVAISFCSFPFQFYIGKDFFFILWDELRNKSISNKIDELKQHTSTRGVYTADMLKKIDPKTFEVIRQPYMKYSNKTYILITTSLYLINFVSALVLMFSPYNEQVSSMAVINELMILWKSPI